MTTWKSPLFFALLMLALPRPVLAETEPTRASAEGFYPIWENTGFIAKHRSAYIGTNGAHFGVQDIVQIGVQPVNFVYRSPNVFIKGTVWNSERHHVSALLGAYYLLPMASRAAFSPNYSSRLDNPDFSMALIPVSIIASSEISNWLQIHQTLTGLSEISNGPLLNTTFFGYTVVAEMFARRNSSVLLHAGEVGFWNHDFNMLGMSYRYSGPSFEFRLGYFYRERSISMQSGPLVGFGWQI